MSSFISISADGSKMSWKLNVLYVSQNFISELRYIESPRAILLKPIIVAYVQHSSSSNSSFVWALVL